MSHENGNTQTNNPEDPLMKSTTKINKKFNINHKHNYCKKYFFKETRTSNPNYTDPPQIPQSIRSTYIGNDSPYQEAYEDLIDQKHSQIDPLPT
jgi:hypothetical protein